MMMPDVRAGEPHNCGSLAVFPLFSERSLHSEDESHYVLAHEAMARGTVAVTEVSDEGSIPDLLVENNGDLPCLLLEGTELRGSKQTRMLNTTTLVGSKSQIRIPVSCVEHGRWRRDSQQSSSGTHCPPTLRGLLKGSSHSPRRGLGSHQIAMWSAIRRKHRALGVTSATEDLSAAMETHREKLERMKTQFPYPANASGIAVAISGRVVAIDIFGNPAVLQKVWGRFQEGMLLDLLEVPPESASQATVDVSAELYRMRSLHWCEVKPVGLGKQYRSCDSGVLVDVLLHEGKLLHASASLRFPR
jgi:hypothetical protein